jgi:hypothetical protein
LQRPNNALFEIEGNAQPEKYEEEIDRPLRPAGVVIPPQQKCTEPYRREPGGKREERNPSLESQPAAALQSRV